MKRGHITVDKPKNIIGECLKALGNARSLCLKIGKVLFRDTARLALGIPTGDPNQLNKSMNVIIRLLITLGTEIVPNTCWCLNGYGLHA